MAGIDQELSMREMAVGGNPQAAQQKYAQSKNLLDLLVAQKVSNDYASARNAMQAATQAPAGTVKDQLDMSNAQVTKNDMMRSMMPGVQMKAARDSQAMQRQAMGIPTQPAPNIRMADGGIVGYKDGGLLDRIMNYIRSIEFGGTSDAADEYNRIVMNDAPRYAVIDRLKKDLEEGFTDLESRLSGEQKRIGRGNVLGGRGTGTPVTDSLGQMGRNRERETSTSTMPLMPMPRPDDRAPRAAVSGPPTRAEKFAQMFPKAREYVNRGDGSAMGGLQYLQMVGRKQQEAKEEEARRAANYIKMLARSQDMIDEVDPANTLPPEITAFAPGGGVEGEEYVSPGLAASREKYDPERDGTLFSNLFKGSLSPEEVQRRENFNRIVDARNQAILQDEDPVAAMNAVKRQIAVENLPDIGYQPDTFNVTQMISEVGKDPKDFRMKGVQPEPFRMQGMEASDREKLGSMVGRNAAEMKEGELPEKKGIFDNVDIGRLQAFLAGGAGQTSTAGALGGGLRGLMAEDQRREALASEEAIEAAKIAATRYGAQLDYDAALAGMDADLRDLVAKAELDAVQSYDQDQRQLARESLADIRNGLDELFNQEVLLLRSQYDDDPEGLARELNAATRVALKRRVDAGVQAAGGATGAFDTDIPEAGAE